MSYGLAAGGALRADAGAGRGCERVARIVLENTLAVDNEATCEKVATEGWREREFDGG